MWPPNSCEKKPHAPASRADKAIAAAAMLSMLLLAFIAGQWLRAGIYYYQAKAYMDSWDYSSPLPHGEWKTARKALDKALALGPSQAIYHQGLSELLFAKSMRPAPDPDPDLGLSLGLSANLQKQALEHIRQAVYLRPSWPYAWALLALIKYQSSGIDAEAAEALDKAMTLGPWEPTVQITVAEIGLASWNGLAPGLREKLIDVIAGTAPAESAKILQIVKRLNLLETMCNNEKLKIKWKKGC
jgi:tetratricopeptide (TPR) repeat protein